MSVIVTKIIAAVLVQTALSPIRRLFRTLFRLAFLAVAAFAVWAYLRGGR